MFDFIVKAQTIIFFNAFIFYILCMILSVKSLWIYLKKIPGWLVIFGGALFIYKIFLIPHIFFSRTSFGIAIIGKAKSSTISTLEFIDSSPSLFSVIKFFSYALDGITFEFVINFNIFLSFIGIYFIYVLVFVLFEDKLIAALAALFYAVAPITFVFSLTEDYTNLAIFFAIQSLCFAAIYLRDKNINFLILAVSSSFLTIGSRPEYIIFSVFFIFFLLFILNVKKRYILLYCVLLIPRIVIACYAYMSRALIAAEGVFLGRTMGRDSFMGDALRNQLELFFENIIDNIAAVLNIYTLMGVFLGLSLLIIFFSGTRIKHCKNIIFFSVWFLGLFFYYSILHYSALFGDYRYIPSLVPAIVVLAAVGASSFLKKFPKIVSIFLFALLVFSLYSTSVWANNRFGFSKYSFVDNGSSGQFIIYNTFKLSRDKLDFSDNSIFITEQRRSYLHSALPIRAKNIYTIINQQQLRELLIKHSGKKIYVAKEECGIFSNWDDTDLCDHWYENVVENYLFIEEVIFSKVVNGQPIFLYKMTIK